MTNWKKYKLGEIGVVITGNTPSKKIQNNGVIICLL